jgi:hypothetical protein
MIPVIIERDVAVRRALGGFPNGKKFLPEARNKPIPGANLRAAKL